MLRRGLGGGLAVRDTYSIKLYFLTTNKHKYMEVSLIARDYGITVEQDPRGKHEVQGERLTDIARYAALKYYMEQGHPVLVEDAGLFIEALNGFPGPYSSYVYKTIGVNGILRLLNGVENRRAYFESAVAIVYEPYIVLSTARVYGEISTEPRGTSGFGFDPIFIPEGEDRTFAEMSTEEKNMYSHRARAVSKAFRKLLNLLKT